MFRFCRYMSSVEFTSNVLKTYVPMNMTYKPVFEFTSTADSEFYEATSGTRFVSSSSDGNTVVVGNIYFYFQRSLFIYDYNGLEWKQTTITVQTIPLNTYPAGTPQFGQRGARGALSSDGNRLLAVSGLVYGLGNANAVEIYHRVNGQWISKAYLHKDKMFGWGYAISGDGNTVALTRNTSYTGSQLGSLHIYKYNAISDEWSEVVNRSYDKFPDQVTLNYDGTILALSRTSNPSKNSNSPQVAFIHILKCTNGTWNTQNDDIIISAPSGIINWHFFGKSLRLSGDGKTLLVGAPGYDTNSFNALNQVYVYTSASGSWTDSTFTILQPASYVSPSANDYVNQFGNVLSTNFDGTIAIIGAQNADVNGLPQAGRAWLFHLESGTWIASGTLDGTHKEMRFGSAVDITPDSYSIFVAARSSSDDDFSLLHGVKKYSMQLPNKTITLLGDVSVSNNVTAKKLGLGIVTPDYPLHIASLPTTGTTATLSSVEYEDYTQWSAYTNKTLVDGLMEETYYFKIPDIGFDFYINGVNIRDSIILDDKSTIIFNSINNASDIFRSVPALINGYLYTNFNASVYYYKGQYKGKSAIYIFYETPIQPQQATRNWCIILISTGNIILYNKLITNTIANGPSTFFVTDGIGGKLFTFPENNTTPNISNQAYAIQFKNAYEVSIQNEGSISLFGNVYTKSIGYDTVLRYPPVPLSSNITAITSSAYGKGTYEVTASMTPPGENPPFMAFYNFQHRVQLGNTNIYNSGSYLGTSNTSYIDFNQNVSSVSGEWIQIKLPESIQLQSFTIIPGNPGSQGMPYKFALLGSDDGVEWKMVYDNLSSPVTYDPNFGVNLVVNASQKYPYYRWVVNGLGLSEYTNWRTLYILGLIFYAHNIDYTLDINSHVTALGNAYILGNVGIGTSVTNAKIHVDGISLFDGNVGIGTTTPATALVVNGTIRNINAPAPTSGTSLVITGDGDIAPQSSDARYKTNVQDLPPILDSIMNLRAVSYNWKEETAPKWYGLLAQQVSDVFPDAAWHNSENDTYGVHYTPTVVTLLLKAVQELKELDAQKTTCIQELTARIQILENK